MNSLRVSRLLVLTALVVGVAVAGCKPGGAGQVQTEEQARTGISKAFGTASPEARALADEAAAALQAQQDVKAFADLSALNARQDLTREQRAAATESMLTVNKRLSEAAARGDKEAAKLMDDYRASK